MDNTVTVIFAAGQTRAVAAKPLYQWAYGQKLVFSGLDLPASYQVDFSNFEYAGTSIPQVGGAEGVTVPVGVLDTGRDVYAFVWIQDENAGRIEYCAEIPVIPCPEPDLEDPNPEEESAIAQAITALNTAVAECEANVEHYPQIVDGYWFVWDAESGEYVNTNVKAEGEDGKDLSGEVNALESNDKTPIPFTIDGAGFVKFSTGTITSSALSSHTDYIDISKFKSIIFKQGGFTETSINSGISFYNSSKTYICGLRNKVSQSAQGYVSDLIEFPVPDGAAYVRCTVFTDTTTYGNFEIYGVTPLLNDLQGIEDDIGLLDEDGNVPLPEFESGCVYLDSGNLFYIPRDKAIRPRYGKGLNLKADDVVRWDDATLYMMLGAYTRDNGATFTAISSRSAPYTIPYDGIYYFTFQYSASTTVSDVAAFLQHFQIFRPSSRSKITSLFDQFAIRSVNHRGFNTTYPENTLPAFIKSAEQGFPIVETDVRFTSDGVAVLLHDASINRTGRNADGTEISGTVNIADITYFQALEYDFGIWKGAQFAGTKIPTLAEAVSCWKQLGLFAVVEIEATLTGANVKTAVEIIDGLDYMDHITLGSFEYKLLAAAAMYSPHARLAYIVENITSTVLDQLKRCKTKHNQVLVDANILNLDSTELALAKTAGEIVEVWTVNTTSVLDSMDKYISGVTSDSVNAQAYFKNKLIETL